MTLATEGAGFSEGFHVMPSRVEYPEDPVMQVAQQVSDIESPYDSIFNMYLEDDLSKKEIKKIPTSITGPSTSISFYPKETEKEQTATSGAGGGAGSPPPPPNYCKNYLLGLCYIPVIGTIPSLVTNCVLAGKLKKVTETGEMKALLTRINQFKIASIVRSLLILAMVIAVLAFGIFTGGIPLALGIGLVAGATTFGLGFVAFHAIQLHVNKGEIKKLSSH